MTPRPSGPRNRAVMIVPILGGRDQLEQSRRAGVTHLIVAFGDCESRVSAGRFAVEQGFVLATAVHPTAVIAASARIGAGTIVAANAVVNPGGAIGESVIVIIISTA